METGIADDAALSTSPATPRRPRRWRSGPRWGSTTCGSSPSGRRSPPANSEAKAPAGFNSADPDSPGYNWSRVDRAVSLVSAAGMRPMLVVTGRDRCGRRRSPRATTSATSRAPTSSASSRAPRRCATAGPSTAGSSGTSRTCRCGCSRRTRARASAARPYAPHLYRRLVRAAYPAIKAVDPTSTVLFGALAPRGENPTKQNARTTPLAFIRSMGCVKARSSAIAPGRARASSR